MRVRAFFALSAAALLLTGCAPATSASSAEQTSSADDSGCVTPESGVIKPPSTGLPEVRLKGPFLVKSMLVGVDPANPQTFGSVQWSKGSVWFPITEFKGPFYLAAGETLSAEVGKSPWVTVYSGCRLQ